jgi:hypothetical protein
VAGELVVDLVRVLRVVFATSLAKTKLKCNKNATAIQAKKETIVVACPTTVLGI